MKRKLIYFFLCILFLIAMPIVVQAETVQQNKILSLKPPALARGSITMENGTGYVEYDRNVGGKKVHYYYYLTTKTTTSEEPYVDFGNWFVDSETGLKFSVKYRADIPTFSYRQESQYAVPDYIPGDAYNIVSCVGWIDSRPVFGADHVGPVCRTVGNSIIGRASYQDGGTTHYFLVQVDTRSPKVEVSADLSASGDYTPVGNGRFSLPLISPSSNDIKPWEELASVTGTFSHHVGYPPLVTPPPPLPVKVGWQIIGSGWAQGMTGSWGYHTQNAIPPLGTILRSDIPYVADPYFSGTDATGTIHNIGIRSIPIQVKDSSGSPNPAADITNTTRVVTSTTDTAPTIRAEIPAGAVNAQGGSANASVPYSSTGNNSGGGVDGWTNFPVTVTCDASAITGDYLLASVWSPPDNGGNFPGTPLDRWLTITGAPGEAASASTVFKEPAAPGGGWFTSGWCADRANQVFLSPKVPPVELKYDPGAPAAGLSFHPETKTFSDTSSDGLSGINPLKTSILFCTVGGAAPGAANTGWQLLSNYNIPITATNYDVYVKAYDKAGNYDIRLANGNLKLHGSVEASIDTDKGAAVHAANCPNLTSPTKIDGSCTADCHDAAMLELTEGSTFSYIYTLHDTDDYAGAAGAFTNYLPMGVIPVRTGITNITSTSGNATATGTVAASPEILGAHAGQYKVTGTYTLDKVSGGDTVTFEVGCRTPQYDPASGTGNVFANHEGNVSFTMNDGYTGTSGYASAVHKVKPLPMHGLGLAKTVTGKYGNRDKAFAFRLDMEQPWGPKLNRTCSYSKASGASGTMTIKNGAIETIDGTQTDSISLKHGESIKIEGLPEGCRYSIAEEPHIGYTTTEKVDGADYSPASAMKNDAGKKSTALKAPTPLKQESGINAGELPGSGRNIAGGKLQAGNAASGLAGSVRFSNTAAGVVTGTIGTANVQVDYFNDRGTLAPPTGINIPGGGGILLMILAVSAVLGGGFFLWKKKSRRVFVGFLALAPILMAALPFTGSRAYAADAVPPLTVRQEIMVEDGTPPTERISYHMAAVTPGAPLPAGAAGDYPFAITGTGEYALPDIAYSGPGEYLYEISPEAGAGIPGFTYDGTVFTVVEYVTAGTDGWDISRAIKDPEGYKCGGVGYRHSYRPQASDPSVMVDPPVRKRVDGSPDKAGSFRFSLTAEKETYPMPDGSRGGKKAMAITGPGEKDFGTWAYTHTGTYRYSIAEADAGEEGYTYDKTVYTITDVVTDQGGVLKVGRTAADGNGKPVTAFLFTNRYQKDSGGSSRPPGAKGGNGSSVLSGDAARPARWALMQAAAGISLLALGCAGRKRRRCKEERRPR